MFFLHNSMRDEGLSSSMTGIKLNTVNSMLIMKTMITSLFRFLGIGCKSTKKNKPLKPQRFVRKAFLPRSQKATCNWVTSMPLR